MHPNFLDNLSWEMAEVYGAITDQILINLARHFPFYVAGEDLPKSAFAYQAQMLAQMGQVNAETIRIIRNGLADADPALVNCLEQSIIDSIKATEPDLAKAAKRGILNMPVSIPIAPNQYRAFNLYYKQAADKLNLVNTVMLESTQSAYRQAVSDVVSQIEVADMINRTQIAIDTAAGETLTGVSSWNQALRHACDKMNNGGIVGFIDHAGHRWSAEAYVAMDIRTTVYNTGRAAVWETNEDFGNDLYSVSYHNGARPLCYPWQNKVISSMDAARTVVDLDGNEIQVIAQSATSYGAPAGLFGINCKHYPTPFIPGVSVLTGQPQNEEDNKKTYEESQEQRRLERKLREEKRDYLTAKAQGRPQEELDALQQKCRNTSGDIDEFCKKTGRARHRDREGVYTKREFPDSQKYDVADFERKQKTLIDSFYQGGGAQSAQAYQYEAGSIFGGSNNGEKIAEFKPSDSIKAAEDFARQFVDTANVESIGVSYDGLSVETANIVNQRITEFVNSYDVGKFNGIVSPEKGSVLWEELKDNNAAFGLTNRNLLINREKMATPEIFASRVERTKQIVSAYMKNPEEFISTYNPSDMDLRILEGSRKSGRAFVSESIADSIDHELGHALKKRLVYAKDYVKIMANWEKKAISVSGYATTSFDDYIAESFSAWKKGEKIDRTLEKAFKEIRR